MGDDSSISIRILKLAVLAVRGELFLAPPHTSGWNWRGVGMGLFSGGGNLPEAVGGFLSQENGQPPNPPISSLAGWMSGGIFYHLELSQDSRTSALTLPLASVPRVWEDSHLKGMALPLLPYS